MPEYKYEENNAEGKYPTAIRFNDTEIKKDDEAVATDLIDCYDTQISYPIEDSSSLTYDPELALWVPGEGAGKGACNILKDDEQLGFPVLYVNSDVEMDSKQNGSSKYPFLYLRDAFIYLRERCIIVPEEGEDLHIIVKGKYYNTGQEVDNINYAYGHKVVIEFEGADDGIISTNVINKFTQFVDYKEKYATEDIRGLSENRDCYIERGKASTYDSLFVTGGYYYADGGQYLDNNIIYEIKLNRYDNNWTAEPSEDNLWDGRKKHGAILSGNKRILFLFGGVYASDDETAPSMGIVKYYNLLDYTIGDNPESYPEGWDADSFNRNLFAATMHNDEIYVYGGFSKSSGSKLNTMFVFSEFTGWREIPTDDNTLDMTRGFLHSVNGVLYSIGGDYRSDISMFDEVNLVWVHLHDIIDYPLSANSGCRSFHTDTHIFLVWSRDNTVIYDTTNNTFEYIYSDGDYVLSSTSTGGDLGVTATFHSYNRVNIVYPILNINDKDIVKNNISLSKSHSIKSIENSYKEVAVQEITLISESIHYNTHDYYDSELCYCKMSSDYHVGGHTVTSIYNYEVIIGGRTWVGYQFVNEIVVLNNETYEKTYYPFTDEEFIRAKHCAIKANGYIWEFFGEKPNNDRPTTVGRYDVTDNSWESYEPIITGSISGRVNSSVMYTDNNFYIFGGKISYTKTDEIIVFNEDSKEMSIVGKLPFPTSHSCIFFDDDTNRVYIFGGNDQVEHNLYSAYIYDLYSWTSHHEFEGNPYRSYNSNLCLFIDGCAYITGGYVNQYDPNKMLLKCDINNEQWTTIIEPETTPDDNGDAYIPYLIQAAISEHGYIVASNDYNNRKTEGVLYLFNPTNILFDPDQNLFIYDGSDGHDTMNTEVVILDDAVSAFDITNNSHTSLINIGDYVDSDTSSSSSDPG